MPRIFIQFYLPLGVWDGTFTCQRRGSCERLCGTRRIEIVSAPSLFVPAHGTLGQTIVQFLQILLYQTPPMWLVWRYAKA